MQQRRRTPGPRCVTTQALWQSRFWDESVRLPRMFAEFRDAADYANAIPCFGRMARARYQDMVRQPGYDPAKKSIISAFQAKSGGTFLHNRLLQLGYQDFWWMFPSRDGHDNCYASVVALELFQLGGCTCHTHVKPEPNILFAWDRAGVEKIWVHLRNPAESAVSAYHHYRGEGHGEGPLGQQRRDEALNDAPRQGLTPATTRSDFAAAAIDYFIDWIAQWLRFASQRPGLVVFSYYDELANLQGMLSRVFRELGAEQPGAVSAAVVPQDRYRQKATKNWRDDLTPAAQDHIEQRVRAELEEFAAFERLWT